MHMRKSGPEMGGPSELGADHKISNVSKRKGAEKSSTPFCFYVHMKGWGLLSQTCYEEGRGVSKSNM